MSARAAHDLHRYSARSQRRSTDHNTRYTHKFADVIRLIDISTDIVCKAPIRTYCQITNLYNVGVRFEHDLTVRNLCSVNGVRVGKQNTFSAFLDTSLKL